MFSNNTSELLYFLFFFWLFLLDTNVRITCEIISNFSLNAYKFSCKGCGSRIVFAFFLTKKGDLFYI